MKPTVGLTSRYLVIPLSERQDSVGPMAKTVKDAGEKMLIYIEIGVCVYLYMYIYFYIYIYICIYKYKFPSVQHVISNPLNNINNPFSRRRPSKMQVIAELDRGSLVYVYIYRYIYVLSDPLNDMNNFDSPL
jgi:hypothetical protein